MASTPEISGRPLCGRSRRALRRLAALALSGWLLAPFPFAAGPAVAVGDRGGDTEMRSLDEQVQAIKSDVLAIAAELRQLEEKLLYPSETQVSVFVDFEEDESLRLDSVEVVLDGERIAHHIYSFKELEALQKGGVQRIYTGNVAAGEHTLEVTVRGVLPGGGDFLGTQRHAFRTAVEPALVGITLLGSGTGAERIRMGELLP